MARGRACALHPLLVEATVTDSRLRERTRGERDTVRALTERRRAGLLTREQIQLAAYCGHEAARVVVGESCSCGLAPEDATDLCLDEPGGWGEWLRGLERWPGAQLRASLAAAELAWAHLLRLHGSMPQEARRALESVRAYMDEPTDDRLRAWMVAWSGTSESAWLPAPRESVNGRVHEIQAAARAVAPFPPGTIGGPDYERCRHEGERRAREAICAALIGWALA